MKSALKLTSLAGARPLLVLAFLLLITSSVLKASPPEEYRFLSLTDAARLASQQNKPMLLYFGRYGCSTCLIVCGDCGELQARSICCEIDKTETATASCHIANFFHLA